MKAGSQLVMIKPKAASTSYNLKFEIDPENKVMELDEANNIQPGCYTPSTGNYVDNVCG